MYLVRYTKDAERDITDIYFYTYKNWGLRQAKQYTKALKTAVQWIAKDPQAFGTVDRSSFQENCRSYYHQKHMIVYRVVVDSVEIIRILHKSMDIQSHV